VNQGVPRLGEVVKCTVLSRYEKIPVDKLIGTIILERLIDALTLLFVFGITLAIQPDLYRQIISTFFENGATGEKSAGPRFVLLMIIGAILLAILIWMIVNKRTLSDVTKSVQNILAHVWT